MTDQGAEQVVHLLEAHGVRLRVDGDHVDLQADAPPPADLLEAARKAKPALLAYLRRRARCGTLAGPCPLLLTCPRCKALVWRPAGSTVCLSCEDADRGRWGRQP
jgi:hypothetical protein